MYVSWGLGDALPCPWGTHVYDADRWTCELSLVCGWSGLGGGLCLRAVVQFVTRSPLACVRLVACYLCYLLLCVSCPLLWHDGLISLVALCVS